MFLDLEGEKNDKKIGAGQIKIISWPRSSKFLKKKNVTNTFGGIGVNTLVGWQGPNHQCSGIQ